MGVRIYPGGNYGAPALDVWYCGRRRVLEWFDGCAEYYRFAAVKAEPGK